MTKAEKNKAVKFIRRSKLMARLNTISDLLRQIGEIADAKDDALFLSQMARVVESLLKAEDITDVWVDEYRKVFGTKKAGGVH